MVFSIRSSGSGRLVANERPLLGESLSGRDNALNSIRLLLAIMVIIGHTWPLGGFGQSRWERIGAFAVNGFFALSGYLIMGSRWRLSFGTYLWRRAARIFPGFWVCLIVTASVFAPLSTVLSGENLVPSSAVQYVVANAGLDIRQREIDHTLLAVPYPGSWNGSLWTLWYEFVAYLVAGVLLLSTRIRRHAIALFSLALVLLPLVTWLAHGPLDVSTTRYLQLLRLGGFFLAGMTVYLLRDRLRPQPVLAAAAITLSALATFLLPAVASDGLTPGLLAYGLLSFGALLPIRIGDVNDISYGTYVYAFPVQQLLATAGAGRLGFAAMAILATVVTLPLAAMSWFLVERPTLRLAHRGVPRLTRSSERSP